jgi:Carboxypeptidase regulatory-like domain
MKPCTWGIIITALLTHVALVRSSPQSTARQPSGVISGRVVDDEGRPMRGAQVQALMLDTLHGRRQTLPRGNTSTTNDRGEFRLFWLGAGTYYVAVNPNPPAEPSQTPPLRTRLGYIPSDPDATFVTTYFPGTPDIRKAEPVQLGVGELDIRAIQVSALPSRLIRVRIAQPKLVDGIFNPIISFRSLTDSSTGATFPSATRQVKTNEFETRVGLMPGEYRILATVFSPAGHYAGSATVTVDRANLGSIEIPVFRTISIQGNVVSEGKLSALKVWSEPIDGSGTAVAAEVRSNGKFALEGILPGAYTLSVDGLENDAYLARVTLQDEEVSSDNVVIPPDRESVNLTLSIKRR